LAGDLGKRDFADVNASRPSRLKGAIARHSVLVEPDRRRANAGGNVIVACVHDVYLVKTVWAQGRNITLVGSMPVSDAQMGYLLPESARAKAQFT
jgi:hypothetical protein